MNPDTLPALIDCLIPPDDFPGACDGGVCDYIDQLFRTDLAEHAEFFRAGIVATNAEALATYNAPFAVLTREQQIATLETIESGAVKTLWPIAAARFLVMLVNITAEGYYSDPQQGGNRGRASWVMTGDGSLHVTNGGFNPVLTIMALAFRSAEYIARLI